MPRRRSYAPRRNKALEGSVLALMSVFIRKPSGQHINALRSLLPTNAERPVELHPDELERLAVYIYQRLGYRNVKHTGVHSSTDGGVDVWMLSRYGHVEIVQCKQWQNRVGKTELIEFVKTMKQQHAEIGHYWAPGGFSQPAVEYAEKNGVKIYADYGIRKLLEQAVEVDKEIATSKQNTTIAEQKRDRKGWTKSQVAIVIGMFLVVCALLYTLLNVISGGG
jgi:restriction endonuclease Mrr